MNEQFLASKNIIDIIEFDKTHQLWRVCSQPEQVYPYADIIQVHIMETPKKKEVTKNVLNNVAASLATPVSFAQSSASIKVEIQVDLNDGEKMMFPISKDYVPNNSLDYHSDKRKAAEVKKALQVVAKRNKDENNH